MGGTSNIPLLSQRLSAQTLRGLLAPTLPFVLSTVKDRLPPFVFDEIPTVERIRAVTSVVTTAVAFKSERPDKVRSRAPAGIGTPNTGSRASCAPRGNI